MIASDELTRYLNDYLACTNFNDYAPNGLQIEGTPSIKRICTAVTASYDVIEKAIDLNADALLVHHGYFWRGEDPAITGMKHKRIAQLIKHDLNLYAYHLPLDCHPVIGNNACIGQRLEVLDVQMHPAGKTANLLWTGALHTPITIRQLSERVGGILNREPLCIKGSTKLVQRLAWCTGGAQDFIEDAYRLGVDAYLSGEISERTYYQAKELGIHYLSCGHHATERYGIQALGEHLVEKFNLVHQFIDNLNPV